MNKWAAAIIIVVILAGIGILVSQSSNTKTSVPSPASTTQQTASPLNTEQQPSSPSATAEQNMIALTSSGFEPASLNIKVGETVRWVNNGGSDATVNSAPHPAHTDYMPLNLDSFSDGSTLSLTFDKAGTYKYHNHLNPGQFGSVIVQ